MGKIGDLLVRLGLKSDGFKKGIENAKQEVQNFGKKLSNMKAGAVAIWAAIGTAVVKFGQDFIGATNKMSDAFEASMAKMKAEYHAFLAAISNTNFGVDTSGSGNKITNAIKNEIQWWKRLIGTVKESGDAAKEAAQSFDQQFELVRSVNLQRRMIQGELNELEVKMRDTTLSPAARQAAADRYYQLLEPIAIAESKIYKDMLSKAVGAWSAGMGLDRTEAEILEFFANVGTQAEAMAAKFPDINDVFQNKKGDKQNDVIFQMYDQFLQSDNQLSDVKKKLGRTTNAIKAEIKRELDGIAAAVKEYGKEDLKLDLELDVELEEIDWSALEEEFDNNLSNLQNTLHENYAEIDQLNSMLAQSLTDSFSSGLQALTDFVMGVDGASTEQVMAAFIQPIANMMKSMGEMFMAEGIAELQLITGTPAQKIAAGAALIAVSSAISSGLAKMSGALGGTSASTSAAGSSSGSGIETYQQEITVNVVGEISGDKIVLIGQKTLNKWSR